MGSDCKTSGFSLFGEGRNSVRVNLGTLGSDAIQEGNPMLWWEPAQMFSRATK